MSLDKREAVACSCSIKKSVLRNIWKLNWAIPDLAALNETSTKIRNL